MFLFQRKSPPKRYSPTFPWYYLPDITDNYINPVLNTYCHNIFSSYITQFIPSVSVEIIKPANYITSPSLPGQPYLLN
ncbi:hypothetical protein CS542_09710 [Pedobacter sp. IW39]|nr:hypothetical protein CS542_09710 [Pedobacter sp. IW39]